jgi:magnesium-transporting ATPase (P-type)
MKIRPKPRKYNPEDLDESYFAAKSNEDGNVSREENPATDKSDFFNTQKREFKILDKKNAQRPYASNKITSSTYTFSNFIPLNLIQQFSKRSNLYFLVMMVLQMVPSISITGG